MSKTLDQTLLIDLVPPSISGDEQIQDMAEAIQPQLDEITAAIPTIEIYRRIDELPEDVLRLLAWENRVYGVEWRLALTLEDKRALVKGSFELNKRRGTRWAVERVFDLIGLYAEIKEWWEPGESGDPATFRIAILDVTGRGIAAEEIDLLDDLVRIYRPLTRHLEGVNLLSETDGEALAHGATSFVASYEFGYVDPQPPETLTVGGEEVTADGETIIIS